MIFYILGAKQFESLQDHRNVLRQWPLPQCLQRRYAKLAQQLCHLASNRFKYIGWLHMVYTKNTLQHIYSNNNNCRCISLLAEQRIFFQPFPQERITVSSWRIGIYEIAACSPFLPMYIVYGKTHWNSL